MSKPNPAFEERLDAYIEHRVLGMTPRQAAKAAGYADAGHANRLEQHEKVVAALETHRAELKAKFSYTRDKAVQTLYDAIDMAKLMSDPATMIRAVNELNRMHGYHAPEVRKIEFDDRAQKLLDKLEQMDEEQLLQIGYGVTIEGEVVPTH